MSYTLITNVRICCLHVHVFKISFYHLQSEHYYTPRHLCQGVYSFRLSVRPFVCSFVRSYFRHVCRKDSYLVHSYLGGLTFTP